MNLGEVLWKWGPKVKRWKKPSDPTHSICKDGKHWKLWGRCYWSYDPYLLNHHFIQCEMVILPGFQRKTLICSCSFRSFFGPLTGDTSHGMSGCLVFPGICSENGRGVGMATARERSEVFVFFCCFCCGSGQGVTSDTHVFHYFSRYFLRCCGTLRMFSVFCFVFMPGAHSHADPYASAFRRFRCYIYIHSRYLCNM